MDIWSRNKFWPNQFLRLLNPQEEPLLFFIKRFILIEHARIQLVHRPQEQKQCWIKSFNLFKPDRAVKKAFIKTWKLRPG